MLNTPEEYKNKKIGGEYEKLDVSPFVSFSGLAVFPIGPMTL